MAISYKSILPEYKDYVSQIPVDLLMRVGATKEAEYQQGIDQIQKNLDYYGNLPSLPGADTEKKNQIINEMTQQLNSVGRSDFGDKNVVSQIDAYTNQYSQSPDLQGISARASKYIELEKKRKKLTENGEDLQPYDLQGLNEVSDYINKGNYIQQKRFNGDIYKSYNFDDKLKEYMKDVEDQWLSEGKIEDGWRDNYEIKQKTESDIREAAISRASTDPQFMKPFTRMFDYNYKQNPQAQQATYVNGVKTSIASAQLLYKSATDVLAHKEAHSADELKQAQVAAQSADTSIKKYTDLLNNIDNDAVYEANMQEHLEHMIGNTAKSFAYTRVTKRQLDEVSKLNLEHTNKMAELAQTHTNRMEELGLTFGSDGSGVYNYGDNALVKFVAHFGKLKDGETLPNSSAYGTLPAVSYIGENGATLSKAPDSFKKKGNLVVPILTIEETTNEPIKGADGKIEKEASGRIKTKPVTGKHEVEGTPIPIEDFIQPDKFKNKFQRAAALRAQHWLEGEEGTNVYERAQKLIDKSGKPVSATTPSTSTQVHTLPTGQADSIEQGGFKYYWNPQTGKYE